MVKVYLKLCACLLNKTGGSTYKVPSNILPPFLTIRCLAVRGRYFNMSYLLDEQYMIGQSDIERVV
jgi:hypothetical protein